MLKEDGDVDSGFTTLGNNFGRKKGGNLVKQDSGFTTLGNNFGRKKGGNLLK